MEKVTCYDGAMYLVERFNDIWKERDLGDLPTVYFSRADDGSHCNVSAVSKSGMTPFITINNDLIAKGTKPNLEPLDLNDGEDFYDLIDLMIAYVV